MGWSSPPESGQSADVAQNRENSDDEVRGTAPAGPLPRQRRRRRRRPRSEDIGDGEANDHPTGLELPQFVVSELPAASEAGLNVAVNPDGNPVAEKDTAVGKVGPPDGLIGNVKVAVPPG